MKLKWKLAAYAPVIYGGFAYVSYEPSAKPQVEASALAARYPRECQPYLQPTNFLSPDIIARVLLPVIWELSYWLRCEVAPRGDRDDH